MIGASEDRAKWTATFGMKMPKLLEKVRDSNKVDIFIYLHI